jgi:hypothetical protein
MHVTKAFLLVIVALSGFGIAGCGGGDNPPPDLRGEVEPAPAVTTRSVTTSIEAAPKTDTKSLVENAKVPVEDESVWAKREKKWAEEKERAEAEKRRKAEEDKWRVELLPELLTLANNCRKLENADALWTRGKVMVWDVPLNTSALGTLLRLPRERRAEFTERDGTVLLIMKTEHKPVTSYRDLRTGQWMGTGFTAEVDLVVLDLPTKHVFGQLHLSADSLPTLRTNGRPQHEFADKAALLAALVVGLPSKPEWEELKRQKEMVATVTPLVKQCKPLAANTSIRPQKKRLVWLSDYNSRSPAHEHLPKELQATGADTAVTFFFVIGTTRQEIGRYRLEGERWVLRPGLLIGPEGYRQIWDVAVVDGARKQAVGRLKVEGPVPPVVVDRSAGAPVMAPDKGLAEWVAQLPSR